MTDNDQEKALWPSCVHAYPCNCDRDPCGCDNPCVHTTESDGVALAPLLPGSFVASFKDPVLDAMCDALLMEYGLAAGSVVMSLEDARAQVRAKASAVIERLREDNIDLIDTEVHSERPEPRWW